MIQTTARVLRGMYVVQAKERSVQGLKRIGQSRLALAADETWRTRLHLLSRAIEQKESP